MQKLGFGDEEKVVKTVEEPVAENTSSAPAEPETGTEEKKAVDMMAILEELSAQNPGLNWKTSIVDLMKLLGIDSAYAHRKALAEEVGIDGYEGTAEQNIILHKAVLSKLAENGGNIPDKLLS